VFIRVFRGPAGNVHETHKRHEKNQTALLAATTPLEPACDTVLLAFIPCVSRNPPFDVVKPAQGTGMLRELSHFSRYSLPALDLRAPLAGCGSWATMTTSLKL
jgi:hypothetical protein